ncbi:MAG: C_GCAxxG_C_C family protein [Clostridia bacterium]|nr:C_GCAxxG_C_C family protein [Clostridia bacterium]
MSKYVARARELRAIVTPHYNCGQAVILPFAEEMGIPSDLTMRFAANYGGGMKTGALCGGVAGGVTVLALYGLDTPDVTAQYYARVREKHAESIDCRVLLQRNAEAGNEKKPFCDGLVYECIEIAEDMLQEAGKIHC